MAYQWNGPREIHQPSAQFQSAETQQTQHPVRCSGRYLSDKTDSGGNQLLRSVILGFLHTFIRRDWLPETACSESDVELPESR